MNYGLKEDGIDNPNSGLAALKSQILLLFLLLPQHTLATSVSFSRQNFWILVRKAVIIFVQPKITMVLYCVSLADFINP